MTNACTKALKALNAIKLIKKYLNKTEILQLITSNVYSVLYYNSEIWHLPNLKSSLKQKLLNVSARALKISMFYPDPMISFLKIHEITKRAPPRINDEIQACSPTLQDLQFSWTLTWVGSTKLQSNIDLKANKVFNQ